MSIQSFGQARLHDKTQTARILHALDSGMRSLQPWPLGAKLSLVAAPFLLMALGSKRGINPRRRVCQAQLHGWHCVIEDGEVPVFDVRSGRFVTASVAEHSGDGPFDTGPVYSGGADDALHDIS